MFRLFSRQVKVIISTFACVLLFSGCSTAPEKQYQDPFEDVNRKLYKFNEYFDEFLLIPATKGYKAVTPKPVEEGLRNAFSNLFYPQVFISYFLQGKPGKGFEGVSRFVMNSTFGLAGLIDISSDMGLEKEKNDFGQVFAQWGFGSGPYLVVPLFGSYTLRHGLGNMSSNVTNPTFYMEDSTLKWSIRTGVMLDLSAQNIEERELVKGDKYLFMRDAYLQNRKFLIEDDTSDGSDPFLDDF